MLEDYIKECSDKILNDSGNTIGDGVQIFHPHLVNIYGAHIGSNCRIGAFVEIQKGAVIGDSVKIQSSVFICEGVVIEDNAFISHGVRFTNDRYPKSVDVDGNLISSHDQWNMEPTFVRKGASIGTNSTILPGIEIGEYAIIGAGSVVTKDVDSHSTYAGNPAKKIGSFK